MMTYRHIWLAAAVAAGLANRSLAAADVLPATVEFNRDIRPILSDACFQCHGPDAARRKADLRLDMEDGMFADRGGYRLLVPKDPAQSELYRRLTTESDGERMPPAKFGRKLSDREIALVGRWIEQGSRWQKHWAFLSPARPVPPAVKDAGWARNPIDRFILERLEREGLRPSPEADRVTLLRRVTLDLTGVPPTIAEVDAFLTDSSPDAYEKVVARLLASPRYGERMARPWLDGARYADSNGYQNDGERFMWRWRDWVIHALNQNMPFDRFTIEQIAGDLLLKEKDEGGGMKDEKKTPNDSSFIPHPSSLNLLIATGFNRNHRGNSEGGIVPEEYAVEYVADRVETTAAVWLGLTLTCSRCHDHKYDPVSQKEFYQLFSFFNNVPERGKAIKYGNSPPLIKAPTIDQQRELRALDDRIRTAEAAFAKLEPAAAKAQRKWELAIQKPPADWTITEHQAARFDLDGSERFAAGDPVFVPGRLGQAAQFDGQRFIDAGNVGNFGFYDKFSLAAWIMPEDDRGGIFLSRMTDTARAEGYALDLKDGHVHVYLIKRWLDDAIRIETEETLKPGEWHHVVMTYDASRIASGVRVYINGMPAKIKVNLDDLNQSFKSKEPFRIGSGGGDRDRFHGLIDDVRIHDDCLSADEAAIIATPETIAFLAALPQERRTPFQALKLRTYYLENHAPEPIRAARKELLALREERDRLWEDVPTTMVMEEMPTPRDAFILLRGQYDKPGEKVGPGVPAALSSYPPGQPLNRLGLARWLVDPTNPLTARVQVNRYWQLFFGTGLVKTAEDFGAQGEWPSHPELLDFLATEFTRTGWDVKAMHRLIVTSAAYRQSSKVSPALMQKDPENRLLGRGPRMRLAAETVRDQALFASGLLVDKLGGPSVKPYQPAGLWKELSNEGEYEQDHGENLYRRSLYTFWKRTIPPPAMITFDAAGREACCVRETRTNTPLQALNLMNDVTFVEAARVLAQRALTEAGGTPTDRVSYLFRRVLARRPRPAELAILVEGFQQHLADYRQDKAAAQKLVEAGESKRDERLDVSELAAYTAVAGLILNLDETITKE